MYIKILGYAAMMFLMLGGLPQAYKTFKQGHANGVSSYYINFLLTGFILMLIFVCLTNKSIPLIVNYIVNIIAFLILAWFKSFPRVKNV
jgi:uncharacterized protein with PQ loop repeat